MFFLYLYFIVYVTFFKRSVYLVDSERTTLDTQVTPFWVLVFPQIGAHLNFTLETETNQCRNKETLSDAH